MDAHMHVHVHACLCECVHVNLGEYVQMSADVHTSGKTDEDDRCECIRAWVCVCEKDGGEFMCAWWKNVEQTWEHKDCSLSFILLPITAFIAPSPTFLQAQTLPVVTLEYCRPGWSTPLLGRRMSAQARGSFDKQSIYWYMIKYARNHPTAEGYYSFNIIIWINKHSVEK